eukprot:jgi/Undpi1/2385/HiC_scaffold_13.g05766.m1
MVVFSEITPFLQDEDGNNPDAVASQHIRSLRLLKSLVQIDTTLAGFLVLALVGKDHEALTRDEQKVQVILQVVTCSVFLAATAHAVVLMVCTGWRYTLAWYDPLFPAGFSAVGMLLLYITIADAVLIQLRADEDLDTAGYWCVVIFGLMMPMFFAGPMAILQMVLHKFHSDRDISAHSVVHRDVSTRSTMR